VVLSRPEIDLKESISGLELAAFPRALSNSDGHLRIALARVSWRVRSPTKALTRKESSDSMQEGALLSLMIWQSFS